MNAPTSDQPHGVGTRQHGGMQQSVQIVLDFGQRNSLHDGSPARDSQSAASGLWNNGQHLHL